VIPVEEKSDLKEEARQDDRIFRRNRIRGHWLGNRFLILMILLDPVILSHRSSSQQFGLFFTRISPPAPLKTQSTLRKRKDMKFIGFCSKPFPFAPFAPLR